jgi:multidrug efflux pump subunit AcrA (membrane-fusion protein)
MIRTYLIPILAIAGVLFAVVTVVKGSRPPVAQPPVTEPPRAPFASFVAGSGLVEASSQNIAIGAPVGAIVVKMNVRVGDDVKTGDVLFELDTREQQADLNARQAQVSVAAAQVAKLEAGTRPELLPTVLAKVAEAESSLADTQNQLTMYENLSDPKAVSADELSRRRYAVRVAEARLAQAKADVALLKAGTWAPDLAVARSQLEQARAQAAAAQVEVDRRIVRSPIDARVLQVNVRLGEFAAAGTLSTPLMLVGSVNPLHVRIDVDENEAWRASAGAKAVAFVRGNKDLTTPLAFVRFEPYVVPKRSLTGDSMERVDTRVLQVIYSFDPAVLPVFVGQQMDVYIEAPPLSKQAASSTPSPSNPQPAPKEIPR